MKRLLTVGLLLVASSALAASISFQWDPNTESDLAGYTLYHSRSANMADPTKITQTTATTFTFNNVSAGRPYHFAVKAKNTSGIESTFSNIVYYSQPLPPSSLQMIVNQIVIQ